MNRKHVFNKGSDKIKVMIATHWIILSLVHTSSAFPAPTCALTDQRDSSHMVERINERYDDFFRYRQHIEERERARDVGRGENKKRLVERGKKIEQARILYIKNRRPPPDTTEAEKRAEAEKKARLTRIEEARRCFVAERKHAEQLLKRGRKIPENEEYDLSE